MQLVFRAHAIRRMFQRGMTPDAVRRVVEHGEVIEVRSDGPSFSSRLLLGWVGGRPLHVAVAEDAAGGPTIVITVYEPDPVLWQPGFRRRRKA